jgi:CRISPR-associated endoribonuclease Cas6
MPARIDVVLAHKPELEVYPARLHGAACAWFEHQDSDHSQRKTFSVGPLTGNATESRWTLGWLGDANPPPVPDKVTFGESMAVVVDSTVTPIRFAQLASAPPAALIDFEIVSPMFFSRNGRDYPLPDPVLVTGSLAASWNRHAKQVQIGAELLEELARCVYLADMDGYTARAPVSYSVKQVGYIGTFTIGLTAVASHECRSVLAALARFAPVSGVGASTARGFGACDAVRVHPWRGGKRRARRSQ